MEGIGIFSSPPLARSHRSRVEVFITNHLRDLMPDLEKYKVVQTFHVKKNYSSH